jgi:molybdopterin-guanine dinucleotide biosynthesis protein A
MLSAAILAGGQSRRFGGRDKSALRVAGQSLLDRQLAALAPIADDLMVVGGATMNPAAPADAAAPAARVVVDRVAGCGPLAGLDAALAAARHDVVVVTACDMPFVTTALFAYLASLASVAGDAQAVVPETEDGYHPLCAAYTRSCQGVVARHLADGRLALRELLAVLKVRTVPYGEIARFGDPRRLLANVNTPAAFEEIEALQAHEA